MDHIEERIIAVIEENRDRILEFGRDIYTHAETGYMEERTSAKFYEQLQRLHLRAEKKLAVTGVKARMDTGRSGPCIALLGEMDGIQVPAHPFTNPETGASHACGHHCQLTGVLGAAIALSDPEVIESLNGSVVFFGVPAEEYSDLEYRNQLVREGKIGYTSGKCELIRIGAFDDVDMCISHHSANEISFGSSSGNGFFIKSVKFYGKSAHASAAPFNGVNALYAANLALQAIAMNREALDENDKIRINTILTDGGSSPGVIPESAQLESMIRGKDIDAMERASAVADRCFRAGAQAMGAGLRIETRSGYLPEKADKVPTEIVEMARKLLPDKEVKDDKWKYHLYGSSDLGDLKSLMPILQFHTSGVKGPIHHPDFEVVDEDEAYLLTAKLFAMSTYRLLRNDAKLAKEYIQNFTPVFSGRKEYCAYIDRMHNVYEEQITP